MPRVNLTPENSYKVSLVRCIKSKIELYGLNRKDIARVINKDTRTVSNRYNNPGAFTLEELQRMCKKLHMEIRITEKGVECL